MISHPSNRVEEKRTQDTSARHTGAGGGRGGEGGVHLHHLSSVLTIGLTLDTASD
jgi:hypothetical protein